MITKTLRILSFCLCIAAAADLRAQMPPSPAPPGGGSGPGAGPRPGSPAGTAREQRREGGGANREDQRRGEQSGRKPGLNSNERSGPPQRNALQPGPAGRWWDNKSVVSSVGISREQQKRMDSIFDANRTAIVGTYKAFLKAQDHLNTINSSAHPDQNQVFAAIDAVNQARADLQKAASAMLLQIRSEMTPEQIEKLEKLQ